MALQIPTVLKGNEQGLTPLLLSLLVERKANKTMNSRLAKVLLG
jgi:hypothetical protein